MCILILTKQHFELYIHVQHFRKWPQGLHTNGSPGEGNSSLFTLSCEPRAHFTGVRLKSVIMYNFTTGLLIFLNFEDKIRDFLDNFKGTFPTQLEFLGQSPGFNIYP